MFDFTVLTLSKAHDRERDTVEDLRKRLDRAERLVEGQRSKSPELRKWFWQR